MKKKIIITILTMALLLVSCHKVDYDQLKADFDSLLNSGDYQAANTLYEAADEEAIKYYNLSLDAYAASLQSKALNEMSTEQAKAALNDFLVFEYTRSAIHIKKVIFFSKISLKY